MCKRSFRHEPVVFFEIPGSLSGINFSADIADIGLSGRIAISKWISDENLSNKTPYLDQEIWSNFKDNRPLSISEKLENVLRAHFEFANEPADGLHRDIPKGSGSPIWEMWLAYAGVQSAKEFEWIAQSLVEEGLIEKNGTMSSLTPKGLAHIENLGRNRESKQAFVAMWFDDSMQSAYENAIRPAIEDCGYEAYKADNDRSHSDDVNFKILAEIKKSKFLIADFTHDDKGARGGVYFEAGYARGIGIPVLWAIKKDDVSKMHFDTNHFPHIIWETEEYLKEELMARITEHQHIGIAK